jgi:hypothetical protein
MTVAPPPLMTAPASPALPQTATAIAPAAPPLPVSTAPVPPSTVTPAPARTSTVLQPPSAPAVLPTTPPNDQAVPDAAPAAAPAIAATREVQNVAPPTEAARPMATPIPRCVTARPGPPAGPSAFIMLNGDEAAARTLVAERCADGPVIVKVRPGDGQVCTAILHDAAGVRLRTLERAPSGAGPAGNAAGEVRWVIAAADLRPNLAVRVTCAAPMERDTGSG